MIYRIIDKETKLFKRDDSIWDKETEEAISTPCQQGFSKPKWVAQEISTTEEENEMLHNDILGEWVEGE